MFEQIKQAFGIGVDPNAMNETYGVPESVVRQARANQMAQLGANIYAMSQQLTPSQRAQVAQSMATQGNDFQKNIYNAAQSRLMQQRVELANQKDAREREALARLQEQLQAAPDSPQRRQALAYLGMGDAANAIKAYYDAPKPSATAEKVQMLLQANPGMSEADAINQVMGVNSGQYDIRGDSKTGLFYVHKTDPSRPPIPIEGTRGEAGSDVKFSDRRSLINDYEKSPPVVAYDVLQPTLQSLSKAIYDDTKISDLDFVYGVAKALDPTSVVRESEGQMVISAQGMDAEMLGRLNSLIGRGALTPETRMSLFNLVKRRAMAFRTLAEQQRNQVLDVGTRYNIIGENDLRTLAPIPEIMAPPTRSNSGARQDFGAPVTLPLIRVD